MGDPDVSLPEYNKAVAEGGTFEQAGNFDKAIACYTRALDAISPNGVLQEDVGKFCYCLRSKCYLKLGNPAQALEDAESALAEDKTLIKGLFAKAEALYFKGDFEFALVFYHRGQQMRPDMKDFQLGVQKAREAIDNAIGSTELCQLTADGDLSLYYEGLAYAAPKGKGGKTAPAAKPKRDKKSARGKKKAAPQTGTVRQLLGELYADRAYLEELMNDPSMELGSGPDVKSLASSGLQFLDTRTEFWRQQKPMYVRVNEQKKKAKSTMRATSRAKPVDTKGVSQVAELISQAEASLQDEDPMTAYSTAERALDVASELPDASRDKFLGVIFSLMGLAQYKQDNFDAAIDAHTQDLETCREAGDGNGESRALGNLGKCHYQLGNYTEAVRAWTEKVPLVESAKERAWLHHEIARAHMEDENFVGALESAQAAQRAGKEADDAEWILNSTVLVAQSQEKLGDFTDAVQSYGEAMVMAESLGLDSKKDMLEGARADLQERMQDDISEAEQAGDDGDDDGSEEVDKESSEPSYTGSEKAESDAEEEAEAQAQAE
eukprot:m.359245 g.359245  ORF g.359245 m.359245 type:complete len:550 (+) comp18489_c0_seq1:220-1869(+)